MNVFTFIVILAFVMLSPLFMDFLNGAFKLFPRQQNKIFGYAVFSIVNFSGVFIFYLWWRYYFIFYFKHSQPSPVVLVFQIFISTFLFCRTYYHLLATHFIGPGTTTRTTSHFCKICNSNIINFDHHCVYLANCIGWKNRRHFIMILIFGLSGNLFAILMAWNPFYMCCLGNNIDEKLCSLMESNSTGFLVCICFFFPWCFLLGFEIVLCLTGLTTSQAIKKFQAGDLKWEAIKRNITYAKLRSIFVLENASVWEFLLFPWEAQLPTEYPDIYYE